jgi:hypothetical protein
MTAIAVYPPSGTNGELQFANSSGQFDAAQAFWDSSSSKPTYFLRGPSLRVPILFCLYVYRKLGSINNYNFYNGLQREKHESD